MRFVIFASFYAIFLFCFFVTSCGDVVIKVQKKSKSSDVKTEEEDSVKNGFNLADDYLAELDGLQVKSVKELFASQNGKDIRDQIRGAIRKYRAFLIESIKFPSNPHLNSIDQNDLCKNDKLNISVEDANKYLGILLKASVLANLKDGAAKELNVKLADKLDAITALIFGEIGLNIDGSAQISRGDEEDLTTKGDFSLGLVPIESDSADVQAKDKEEVISLAFDRLLNKDETGSFASTISVNELVGEQINKYEAKASSKRELDADGLWIHTGSMKLKREGAKANEYERTMIFRQLTEDGKQIEVTDIVKLAGQSELKAVSTVNLDTDEGCKVESNEDEDKGSSDNGKNPDDDSDVVIVNPDDDKDGPSQNPSQSPK